MSAPAPLVTVVLPHFGCEPFLAAAVRSILDQELGDLALLVVDDASPGDEWSSILGGFADDPRLAAYRTTVNVGPYRIKNAVLPTIRSPFVAFQDADDRSLPARLQRQIDAMRRRRIDVLGCSVDYLSTSGQRLFGKTMVRNCNLWLRLGKRFVALHPTTVVRREVFDVLGGFDGTTRFAADDDFFLRAAKLYRLRNLRARLYEYRLRDDSLTGAKTTGHGSAAREEYLAGVWERERQRRRAGREELRRSLRAPGNDIRFELRRVL